MSMTTGSTETETHDGGVHDGEQTDEIDELRRELTQLQQDFAGLRSQYQARIAELEETIAERDAEIDDLRERLQAVEDDTEMFAAARKAAAGDRETRAAVVLRNLRQDAEAADGTAEMTVRECWNMLQREPDRTTCYDVLQCAEALVDDTDVCTYITEDRSSSLKTRLRVDLTNGSLPRRVAGVDLTTEVTNSP